MIKMIVCDLDGTILHPDFTYTKRTMVAIQKATSQGILFLPASGRSFQDIVSIFHKEGIVCGAICVNGAQAYDEIGNVLCCHELNTITTKRVIHILQEYHLSTQVFTDCGFYAYQDATKVVTDIEAVVSRNMKKRIQIGEVNVLQEHELTNHSILKLETMSLNDIILEKCRKSLASIIDIEVTSSVQGNLEITHRLSTKGLMLENVLKVHHIKKDEVIIFGDSDNDISMFERFPNTVAVANANKKIKELAQFVCESCEEDGVAKYIEEYICK